MIVLASSACFRPDPALGAPCGPGDVCPSGLVCLAGVCGAEGSSDAGHDSGNDDGMTAQCTEGAACYDCSAGPASCASCTQGMCPSSTCQPSGTPLPAMLASPLNANNGDEGNMFDIVAKQTITITRFDGHLGATGNTEYEIWTRPGTYVGFADSATGWTLVGSATVVAAGTDAFTPIPIAVNITLQAGQRQAFYLTNKASNNRYHNGTQVGAALVSDAALTVYEGAGVNYGTTGFAGTSAPRAWEGRVRYVTGGGATLATPMLATLTSAGVMFDLEPARDLDLSLVAVNLGAGTHDVDVYFRRGSFAGVETTSTEWRRLASIMDVESDGPTAPTALPMPRLFLEAGTTTALYVTTTTSADVRAQPATTATAAMNADLTITPGVTITGSFGSVSGAAAPNVELGYGTCN
jgi:hypothetical protein